MWCPIEREIYQKLHIVLGIVSDKNVENVLSFFPSEARYYFVVQYLKGIRSAKIKSIWI